MSVDVEVSMALYTCVAASPPPPHKPSRSPTPLTHLIGVHSCNYSCLRPASQPRMLINTIDRCPFPSVVSHWLPVFSKFLQVSPDIDLPSLIAQDLSGKTSTDEISEQAAIVGDRQSTHVCQHVYITNH